MKYLLKNYNNVFCIVVGPRPKDYIYDKHIKEINSLENKLKQMKNFLELDVLPHNELKDIYNITDIVLFPTQNDQHPLVAIEAMASKTILISTNDFSLPEMIINGENGFLINNPKKEDEIIEILNNLLKNFDKYKVIQTKARETMIKKFDWRHSAKKFEKICFTLRGK